MKIPVFHFFEMMNEGQLKIVNVNYKKMPDHYVFLIKS